MTWHSGSRSRPPADPSPDAGAGPRDGSHPAAGDASRSSWTQQLEPETELRARGCLIGLLAGAALWLAVIVGLVTVLVLLASGAR